MTIQNEAQSVNYVRSNKANETVEKASLSERKNEHFEEDLLWDQLCINPHEDSLSQGFKEGQDAGLMSGFKDGEAIGRSKALEIGFEIGFYEGCAAYMLDIHLPQLLKKCKKRQESHNQIDVDNGSLDDKNEISTPNTAEAMLWTIEKLEKLQKGWKSLLDMVHQFPTPDKIFKNQESHDNLTDEVDSKSIIRGKAYLDEFRSSNVDIVKNLQRIRSKFKVVTILQKIPKFSLRRLMDEVAAIDEDDILKNEQMHKLQIDVTNDRGEAKDKNTSNTTNGMKTTDIAMEHEW